jgi:hypothetical protein
MLLNPEDSRLQDIRHTCLRKVFANQDNSIRIDFPSALFAELAVITSDDKFLLLRKDPEQSALARVARSKRGLWTCTLEEGLLWNRSLQPGELNVFDAIAAGVQSEFGLDPKSVISDWRLLAVAITHVHLNAALIGYVKLSLTAAEMSEVVRAVIHDPDRRDFLDQEYLDVDDAANQLSKRRDELHPTALMRAVLSSKALGVPVGRASSAI